MTWCAIDGFGKYLETDHTVPDEFVKAWDAVVFELGCEPAPPRRRRRELRPA